MPLRVRTSKRHSGTRRITRDTHRQSGLQRWLWLAYLCVAYHRLQPSLGYFPPHDHQQTIVPMMVSAISASAYPRATRISVFYVDKGPYPRETPTTN